MNSAYFVAPAVGASIGYITNYIAIKMLFRPLKAKYILGIKVPFTPGIIPREKARLAKNIGDAVGEQLLTPDVIVETVTSSYFKNKIETFVDQQIMYLMENNKRIDNLIEDALEPNETQHVLANIQADLSNFLYTKLNSPETIEAIDGYLAKGIDEFIEEELSNPMVKMLIGLNTSIVDKIKSTISEKIYDMLQNNSMEIIEKIVSEEFNRLLNTQINDVLSNWEHHIPKIKRIVFNSFEQVLHNNIVTITSALDISSIVEKRINEFEILEMEELILNIIDKELKAIIWLGALLGLFMGFLMPLFS